MPKLSAAAKLAWHVAASEAAAARHACIEREHLAIGLCSLGKTLDFLKYTRVESFPSAAIKAEADKLEDALLASGIAPSMFRRGVRTRLRPGHTLHAGEVVHRSDACKAIFRRGESIAQEAGAADTSSVHILAALLEEPGAIVAAVLAAAGASAESLRASICAGHPASSKASGASRPGPEEPPRIEEPARAPVLTMEEAAGTQETPMLDRYGRDITRAAREGRLIPFVESERTRNTIRQLIKVLLMPVKNNPVLVGEAGVGKTAIVEALAERIAAGRDRQVLAGKRLVELSMAEIVAGTKYRGEFEERLTRLIEEVRSHPEIVLFIDEFHTVAGAGRAEGAPMDAGNIMKPALARGELRCIGATTIAEYRRSIEKDPALERRFQPIQVAEPGRDETRDILFGLRAHREAHFGVNITDEAIDAAVDLSIRFDPAHFMPDKAIDLLDRACAECRVPLLSLAVESDREGPMGVAVVKPDTVARVVAEKMSIPLEVVRGRMDGLTESRIKGLEGYLKERIIGQADAVSAVCRRLVLAHAGLGDRRRPLGVFLFLGPTGVGKTEMARQMARYLFADERAFIRLDMSEFQEDSSVTRLIGSSPGYIGYEEGGQLTGRLRTTPYSVVLLDEMDKASPRAFDLFLQLFDEGKITDGQGRTADARNAVFIMTGNVRVAKEMGFLAGEPEDLSSSALTAVRRRYRPEFINRIDEQIVFRSLSPADIGEVLDMQLKELAENLQETHGLKLVVEPAARTWLAEKSFSPEYGVRELARVVDRWVRGPIGALSAQGELARRAAAGRPVVVKAAEEGIKVE